MGAQLGWRPAQPDAAHLVILLTAAGWFAVARPEVGGLGVLQMKGGVVQTRLVFDRDVVTAFRASTAWALSPRPPGTGSPRRATARRGTAARRVRRLPCPADEVPATQMVGGAA